MEALVTGDPMDPAVSLGPLVSAEAVTELEDQVSRSVAAGDVYLIG